MSDDRFGRGMSYARVDVRLLSHPKLLGLSASCRLLYLGSVLWSVAHLSDGYIPPTALDTIASQADVSSRWRKRYAAQLVERGLWLAIDEHPADQGGWQINDFHDWQLSKREIGAQRERWRERQRRARASRHGVTHPVTDRDVTGQEQELEQEQENLGASSREITSFHLSSIDDEIDGSEGGYRYDA